MSCCDVEVKAVASCRNTVMSRQRMTLECFGKRRRKASSKKKGEVGRVPSSVGRRKES